MDVCTYDIYEHFGMFIHQIFIYMCTYVGVDEITAENARQFHDHHLHDILLLGVRTATILRSIHAYTVSDDSVSS